MRFSLGVNRNRFDRNLALQIPIKNAIKMNSNENFWRDFDGNFGQIFGQIKIWSNFNSKNYAIC